MPKQKGYKIPELINEFGREYFSFDGSRITCKSSEQYSSVSQQQYKDIKYFRFAPTTSCDVERSFSQYKLCLSDHQHRNFKFENISMYIMVHCNATNTKL